MTDLEYTIQLIHQEATKLAEMTKNPQIGLFTYMQALRDQMEKVASLRVVQTASASKLDKTPAGG